MKLHGGASGWAGIRTLVALRQTRFPGVRIRPLCHPSLLPAAFVRRGLQLQAAKQFVERQLNANVKFAEIGVGRAHFIEAHLVNDGFDLEGIVREKRDAPLRVVEPAGAGDELLDLPGILATDRA